MKSRTSSLVAAVCLAASLFLVAPQAGAKPAKAPKPSADSSTGAIKTFSTEDIAREGIYYAGGQYVGEKGKETMGGDAYVVVWVPKQIKHPYPIVYVHGAGQTATTGNRRPTGALAGPTTSPSWAMCSTWWIHQHAAAHPTSRDTTAS